VDESVTADDRQVVTVELAAKIVAAYVQHNALAAVDLPKLITEVFGALRGTQVPPATEERPAPAVPIRQSIKPHYLICLDDGKKLKSLKRHLALLGMTPAEYRHKWELPRDYPMVAPNYSASRSELAKSSGLGRKRAASPPAAAKSPKRSKAKPKR
jgi:predicted transcriptional regulator